MVVNEFVADETVFKARHLEQQHREFDDNVRSGVFESRRKLAANFPQLRGVGALEAGKAFINLIGESGNAGPVRGFYDSAIWFFHFLYHPGLGPGAARTAYLRQDSARTYFWNGRLNFIREACVS
jgi:hypothetical protein